MPINQTDSGGVNCATPDQVFGLLAEWGLSPEPNSYEIAYFYLDGGSQRLVEGVRREIEAHGRLSEKAVTDLRLRCFPENARAKRIEEIGVALSRETGNLAEVVEKALCLSYKTEIAVEGLARIESRIGRTTLQEILEISSSNIAGTRVKFEALGVNLRHSRDTVAGLDRDLEAIRATKLIDPLIGLANSRQLRNVLTATIARAGVTKTRVVLLLAELDHFGTFIKRHGNAISERVLCLVAEALRGNVPEDGLLARSNGHRFAMVFIEPKPGAESGLAERLRRTISRSRLVSGSNGENLGRITLSIGTAGLGAGENMRSMVEKAGIRLRQAKSAGGDRAVTQ